MCGFKPPKAFWLNLVSQQRDFSWLHRLLPTPQSLPNLDSPSALGTSDTSFASLQIRSFPHHCHGVCLLLGGCCTFFSIFSNRESGQTSSSIPSGQTSVELTQASVHTCTHTPCPSIANFIAFVLFLLLFASWNGNTSGV